nr:immunoglobulin heavy chain junction region [Mus musculus]
CARIYDYDGDDYW